ncbi:MAG: hypothetical protein WD768_22695 [Phycisphaeraceae bacterium]
MTSENFQHIVDTLFERRPFRPFTVVLADGERFEVDHPRAMVTRDGVAVFLAPGGIPVWFDHDSVTQVIGDAAGSAA